MKNTDGMPGWALAVVLAALFVAMCVAIVVARRRDKREKAARREALLAESREAQERLKRAAEQMEDDRVRRLIAAALAADDPSGDNSAREAARRSIWEADVRHHYDYASDRCSDQKAHRFLEALQRTELIEAHDWVVMEVLDKTQAGENVEAVDQCFATIMAAQERNQLTLQELTALIDAEVALALLLLPMLDDQKKCRAGPLVLLMGTGRKYGNYDLAGAPQRIAALRQQLFNATFEQLQVDGDLHEAERVALVEWLREMVVKSHLEDVNERPPFCPLFELPERWDVTLVRRFAYAPLHYYVDERARWAGTQAQMLVSVTLQTLASLPASLRLADDPYLVLAVKLALAHLDHDRDLRDRFPGAFQTLFTAAVSVAEAGDVAGLPLFGEGVLALTAGTAAGG